MKCHTIFSIGVFCGHPYSQHEGDESGMGAAEPCMIEGCECEDFTRSRAWGPASQYGVPTNCPTCKSPARERHPSLRAGLDGALPTHVCKDPWHSSTHVGREMMNKLVGHAYYSQYIDYLKSVTATDPVAAPVADVQTGMPTEQAEAYEQGLPVSELSGTSSAESGGRAESGEGPIAGSEEAVEGLPTPSRATTDEGYRQALRPEYEAAVNKLLLALSAVIRSVGKTYEVMGKVLRTEAGSFADSAGVAGASGVGVDFPNDLDGQKEIAPFGHYLSPDVACMGCQSCIPFADPCE
jgi:hypothetical protein